MAHQSYIDEFIAKVGRNYFKDMKIMGDLEKESNAGDYFATFYYGYGLKHYADWLFGLKSCPDKKQLKKMYNSAMVCYKIAIQRTNDDYLKAEASFNLGIIFDRIYGEKKKALSLYNFTISIIPEYERAIMFIGQLETSRSKF